METYWHKKRLHQLLTADAGTLNEFLDQFASTIYTWMHYQVGADEEIAVELTEKVFIRAIEQLPQFQPRQETLFHWFKDQAKQVRDDELLHRQMKSQRPWAWSQLSDSILYSLSRIRQESLPESVCNNQTIQQIVQAALAEMTLPDRELMMHRYNHLDTPEHIAEEMNIRIEDLEDRLYRCRHSFKRIFAQLIAASNVGFVESNNTAEMEILDSNLEKLLSATEMNLSIKPVQLEKLRIKLSDTAQKSAVSYDNASVSSMKIAITALIAGAVAIAILSVILISVLRDEDEPDTPIAPSSQAPVKERSTKKTQPPIQQPKEKIENEEIQRIFELGAAGNVDALMEILKSGQRISQLTAAIFLGQHADPSAIEALNEAQQQWYPDGPEDNPFATAINAIAQRYPDQVKIIEEDLPKEEPAKPPVSEKPLETTEKKLAESKPVIIGEVRDPENNPIIAKINLIKNLSNAFNDDGTRLASTESDKNGRFQISKPFEGHAFLRTHIPNIPQPKLITRSIWGQKDKVTNAALSARAFLIGNITIDGIPQAERTLYLCDSVDPATAAYVQKTQTDQNGRFEFWTVPRGSYSIFKGGLDNQLHRMDQVEMPATDTHRVNLTIETVQVILELPEQQDEITAFEIVESQLIYMPNASNKLNQYKGKMTKDNLIVFDSVVPGDYLLRVKLDNTIWIQEDVEVVPGIAEQLIEPVDIPSSEVVVTGRFLGVSPLPLFLTNSDQTIHVDLSPNLNGSYAVAIPQDIYQLATMIEGEFVELDVIDLQNETELAWDIEPDELFKARSPLYVVTAEDNGFVLGGALVILSMQDSVSTGLSSSHGAFFAAEPQQCQVSASLQGFRATEQNIEITPGSLLSGPQSNNTVLLRLEKK